MHWTKNQNQNQKNTKKQANFIRRCSGKQEIQETWTREGAGEAEVCDLGFTLEVGSAGLELGVGGEVGERERKEGISGDA